MPDKAPQFSDPPSRRGSKLEPHRELIERWWLADKSARSIGLGLAQHGCEVAYETLRSWLAREVEGGRLPVRTPSRVGRPPRKWRQAVSLGLLPTGEPGDPSETLQFLVLNLHAGKPLRSAMENALVLERQQTGIPLDENLEPDYLEYARLLGQDRLRTLGDMDYYLLATWMKEWRVHPDYGKPSWQTEVLHAAARLRADMLAVVGSK